MTAQLDPWTHAREIAERLGHPSARLVVALGAESWCEKCRALRPVFERWASEAGPHEVWLWLDLEDHAEFVGAYLPPGLPMLFAYEGDRLTHAHVLESGVTAIDRALAGGAAQSGCADPGIRGRLLQADWAM
ncbi:thioredoxin family protein [Ralstonia solanacearum]|uniref:Thioredoxin family protein n=1 Tax=Ralstonia solanacearum TaxID=305 RepID=A0AAE3NEX3_RALSL|nr:thioredoxin family protein [Ralstonia solanacearum]MBB6583592.1 thioredoxin family protein [Ralstonia solanacearum]MDB0520486.1 thioredoxin family protein [Ralstonia solanacearum]